MSGIMSDHGEQGLSLEDPLTFQTELYGLVIYTFNWLDHRFVFVVVLQVQVFHDF